MQRSALLLLVLVVAGSRLLLVPAAPLDLLEVEAATRALTADHLPELAAPPPMLVATLLCRAGLLICGDPIMGLQLIMAVLSVLTVALLATLWQPHLEHQGLGSAAAALYAFCPGVWYLSWRASSASLAVLLILIATLLWSRRSRSGLLVAALCLGGAALVSPSGPLLVLPLLIVVPLWERRRDVLLAAAVALLVIIGAWAPVLIRAGRWTPLLSGVATIPASSYLADLGPVRALGGTLPAALVLGIAIIGLLTSARRAPGSTWPQAALLVGGLPCLLLPGQLRADPGAALPLLALLSGPVVVGLRVVLRRQLPIAVAVLCMAGAGVLCVVPPALDVVQHGSQPLAALAVAAERVDTGRVIYENRLEPFVELLAAASRPVSRLVNESTLDQPDTLRRLRSRSWQLVCLDEPASWVPPPAAQPQLFTLAHEAQLVRLDPAGLYRATLSTRGGLLLPKDHNAAVRRQPAGVLPGRSSVLLEPGAAGSWLGMVLEVQGGEQRLELYRWFANPVSVTLAPGRHTVRLPPARGPEGSRTRPSPVIHLLREDATDDATIGRVLIRHIWIDHSDGSTAPRLLTPAQQASGMQGLVDGDGFYRVERIGKPQRPGRWTRDEAELSVPVGQGSVILALAAPRPGPVEVTLRCPQLDWTRQVQVDAQWQEIELVINQPLGRIDLQLRVANPFVPAEDKAGSRDRRTLGVVLGEIRFQPKMSDSAG